MKRALDVVGSSIGLVMTSPVVLIAAIAVKLESRGPAFYTGERVGRHGRRFHILKLRTMRWGTESQGPSVTAGDDPRITAVGRWLRRIKADEIPQLLNVLKGEMSLVGPRPEHPKYVELYTPEQRRVLQVRPGMTGPSAIAFLDEEDLLRGGDPEATYLSAVMPQKLAMDLQYVEAATFANDLRILGRTVLVLFQRPISA
jgi:lipopolysaccharide/colanic/teichoic acid biosynthesis glycosyltransferase